MTDITTTHLEAAIIDQMVAGQFAGQLYAFNAVYCDGGWQLGVVVANERGYHPIGGKTFGKESDAKFWASGLNRHIGRDDETVIAIVCSSFGGRRVEVVNG